MKNNVLIKFVGMFAASFIALTVLWIVLASFYNAIVFAGANLLFQLDDPVIAEIGVVENRAYTFHINGQAREAVFEFDNYGTFFNVVLLLSLLLATPCMSWKQRLIRSGLAITLIGAIHTLFIVVQTKAQFVNLGLLLESAQSAYVYNWTAVMLGTLGEQLLPLLIVAALTWKAWRDAFDLGWKPTTLKRNAPCFCGSGKKYKHCCQKDGKAVLPRLRAPLS